MHVFEQCYSSFCAISKGMEFSAFLCNHNLKISTATQATKSWKHGSSLLVSQSHPTFPLESNKRIYTYIPRTNFGCSPLLTAIMLKNLNILDIFYGWQELLCVNGNSGSLLLKFISWLLCVVLDPSSFSSRRGEDGRVSLKLPTPKPEDFNGHAQLHLYVLPACSYQVKIGIAWQELLGQVGQRYHSFILLSRGKNSLIYYSMSITTYRYILHIYGCI